MASILNPQKVPFTGADGKITREWFIFLTNLVNGALGGTVTAVTGTTSADIAVSVLTPNTTPSVSAALTETGIGAGSYTNANVTFDAKGRATAASNGAAPLTNPMTTAGDIIVGGVAGAPARLAKGSDGQALILVAGAEAWGRPTVIGAGVYNSAAQATVNNVAKVLAFDSERFDTDNCHDNVTNNSRLTANTAGTYAVFGNVEFPASAAGSRDLGIRLNGVTFIAGSRFNASATGATQVQIQTMYQLAAGDYVELIATQGSGGALNVNASPNYSPEFRMALIGT